jgi:hypothetical protein
MDDNQKIEFWGSKIWLLHWPMCIMLFLLFIPGTIAILFKYGWPEDTGGQVLVIWGLIAGFGLHIFTPMVISNRLKWKKKNKN